MMELVDRKDLLRIIKNGINYNGKCPEWILSVITHMNIKEIPDCNNCQYKKEYTN